jgi:hypothetical protein
MFLYPVLPGIRSERVNITEAIIPSLVRANRRTMIKSKTRLRAKEFMAGNWLFVHNYIKQMQDMKETDQDKECYILFSIILFNKT